ncbi:MAG: hypothetical protein ACOX7U_03295 [Desulfitobacteriia bacterium]
MKKKFTVILLVAILAFLLPMQALAAEGPAIDDPIKPSWIAIDAYYNHFSINKYGLAKLGTSVECNPNVNKIEITQKLQQYTNGRWVTIKSWTEVHLDSCIAIMERQWFVSRNYNYRMTSSASVYIDGTYIEYVSYTSPVHWY